MKRLTQYNEGADEIDFLIDDAGNRGAFDILDLAKYRADYADFDEFLLKIAEKLKKYEDLEEKCIKENSWGLGILFEKWKEFFDDIQELYEYRQLEEQGEMLKLHCAVGDTVYYADNENYFTVHSVIVDAIKIMESNTVQYECLLFDGNGGVETQFDFYNDEFGKIVFLTKEQAEQALEEMAGDK